MLDPKLIDDLSRKVAGSLPQGIAALQGDVQKNLHSAIAAALSRMDLVTREEFDIQTAVLHKTRAKLEAMEAQVAALEAQLKQR